MDNTTDNGSVAAIAGEPNKRSGGTDFSMIQRLNQEAERRNLQRQNRESIRNGEPISDIPLVRSYEGGHGYGEE